MGFDFPEGLLGMSDFTYGVLLKLVLWTLHIYSEDVSMPSGAKLSSIWSSSSSCILGSSSTHVDKQLWMLYKISA